MLRAKFGARATYINSKSDYKAETIAKVLRSAQFALVTGGMCMYEAMTVGCPTIVYPQEQNLIEEANFFHEEKCLFNLGERATEPHFVQTAIDYVTARSTQYSEFAQAACKGLGLQRATVAVTAFLNFFFQRKGGVPGPARSVE
jgi:spore coat polysaccharide biosynthesis predicted glycosyltransferase SpsG